MNKSKETTEFKFPEAAWVSASPFVDTLECTNCGYQIISSEFRTPHCHWCGYSMKNWDKEIDE